MNSKYVSKHYIDEHIVKLVALQVIAIVLLALFNRYPYLLVFLTLDFAIRAFTHLPSPLAYIAKIITRASGLKSKPVFAPPKKFAAAMGFAFSLTISVLLLLNLGGATYAVGGILVFCALLEAVFNVCLGCYVYSWLIAPLASK